MMTIHILAQYFTGVLAKRGASFDRSVKDWAAIRKEVQKEREERAIDRARDRERDRVNRERSHNLPIKQLEPEQNKSKPIPAIVEHNKPNPKLFYKSRDKGRHPDFETESAGAIGVDNSDITQNLFPSDESIPVGNELDFSPYGDFMSDEKRDWRRAKRKARRQQLQHQQNLSVTPTRPLPDWMNDPSLLPKRPPTR